MNPSSPAKFGIAFAAGLVVALAGATVYLKTSGLHLQQTANVAPAVPQSRQPETLNTVKTEEPVAAAQTPNPAAAPAVTPTEKPAAPVVRATPVRIQYPPQSLPKSRSTMRVEVSQVRRPAQPLPESVQPVAQEPQAPPIRKVSEDEQLPPVPAPIPVAPVPQPQQQQPEPPPQPHTVTLQSGTTLVVRMNETLSTDHNYSGDTFRATLDRPIILDGFIIADKGSKVLGKIVGIDKAGKFEGTSNLQLALTEINTTDGQHVRIQTGFFNKKGPANDGAGAAKVGGGAVIGAVIGAIAGGGKGAAIGAGAGGAIGAGAAAAGKGRPAVISTETQLTFQLSAPTTITEHLN